MAPTPISLSTFGGLDLASSPSLIPFERAADCLNVEFSSRGSVRTRGGYAAFSGTLTNQPDSLGSLSTSSGTRRLLVGNGNRIDVLDTTGASVANTTSPTASPHYFVRFGAPSVEALYISNGTDQVRRYDASGGFTTPAGLAGQTGKFLAVTPRSNRLVVARESGTTAGNNPSSVNFSDAGAAETFTSTNFVDLDPGDNEGISGLVTWGNYILVFKPSKLWRHWGESTDQTGEPVFEFAKEETGGVGLSASRALAASPQGVYFLHSTGVYLTTGSAPVRVSEPIDSFFEGNVQSYFKSQPLNHGAIDKAAMHWYDNRLYVAVPTGASLVNDRVLVHDPAEGWWSIYDLPVAAMASFTIGSQAELVFARSSTTSKTVARHKTGEDRYRADDMTTSGTGGAAIATRWRSGWTDFGNQLEKTIRRPELYGVGTADVRLWTDYNYTDNVDGFVQELNFTGEDTLWDQFNWDEEAWGPSTRITRKVWNKSRRATVISLDLSNATLDESWQLNVATFLLTSPRAPGLKSDEGT